MKRETTPTRDMRDLSFDEGERLFADAVTALIDVLKEHRVAGSGSGYSLYRALADEIAKVRPFRELEIRRLPAWKQER